MAQEEQESKERLPPFLSLYIKFYNAVPKIYVPGIHLDVGFMLCWMGLFSMARLFVTFPLLVQYCGWPSDAIQTKDASASLVGSIMHATSVIPLTFLLMRLQRPHFHPSASSKDHPKWWQDGVEATLQICTGYMLYDTIFLFTNRYQWDTGRLVVDDDLLLYAGHHFLTTFYMTTCRIYGAGQASALMCIFLGECTNHPFNLFLSYGYAEAAGVPIPSSGWWTALRIPNEIFLSLLYLPIRVIISPIIAIYMSYNLLTSREGRTYIPLMIRLIWILMIFLVIHGSIGHDIMFYNILKQHLLGTDDETTITTTSTIMEQDTSSTTSMESSEL